MSKNRKGRKEEVVEETPVEVKGPSKDKKEVPLVKDIPEPEKKKEEPVQEKQEEPTPPVSVVEESPKQPTQQKSTSMDASIQTKLDSHLATITSDVSDKDKGKAQYGLLKTMRGILSIKDPSEFEKTWNSFLNFANKNKDTVYNIKTINSYPHTWLGSELEFSLFRRLTWVVLETLDPKVRRRNQNACVNERTVEGLTATERNNLFNFYSN